MRLQQVVWKIPQIADSRLYYRSELEKELCNEEQSSLVLKKGEEVRFDTYFNSFTMKKWRQYTNWSRYSIQLKGQGEVLYQLWGAKWNGENLLEQCIDEQPVLLREGSVVDYQIPNAEFDVCYPVFRCVSEQCELAGIEYHGVMEQAQNDVRMAIDICTFKREPYLERNIEVLQKSILDNQSSTLHDNIEVFISDNANTLGDRFAGYEHVHVNPNANVGGVGGFTRGMLEAMTYETSNQFTHILIMDDDAVIEPSSIEKTYTLLCGLKPEYRNATIGGALLRENTPHVQYESGAVWNRGKLIANHHHYDLSEFSNVVANEQEEMVEYTGWWYSVIPVCRIEEVGLPLPLFIHRDDIEYGIRAGKEQFILMNGIAVWHEAFENKMPGATEYYDLRNMAIINCVHYRDYSGKELKYFLKRWVISNIVRYRYEYVDMNILGVMDFCKGIDWFKAQDGQELHRRILTMNYKAKPAKEYVGYKNTKEIDIEWCNIEQIQERPISRVERFLKQITLNGAIFPASGLKIVRPHNNIYDMFCAKEVLYVDSAGNGLLLKRDNRKAKECFRKLKIALRQIDKEFDKAKEGYASRYEELTTTEFWKKYLNMNG